MKNIKLTVAYDGSQFWGWQETRMGPSIESCLKQALEQILQEKITLQAASRTDRGVHAEGQIVNFFTKNSLIDCPKLSRGLNALIPSSIQVTHVEEMGLSFHPTLDAVGKTYIYEICTGSLQMPRNRSYSWHVPYELNLSMMQKAALHFVGEKDFSAFCNQRKNLNYIHKNRVIYDLSIDELPKKRLLITISGNHFLYKMVRTIVGTLIFAGRGKIQPFEVQEIISSKSRPHAGMTAPAHGLTLKEIFYPKELGS